MDSKEKIDITQKVHGKIDGENMSLYLDKDKIGQIVFTNQGNLYEMAEGFEFEKDKIFKQDKKPKYTEKYVDDCDLGWC
jgi:hypothetical protein